MILINLVEVYLSLTFLDTTKTLIIGHEPKFLFGACPEKLAED
jgi:hypothetical protein